MGLFGRKSEDVLKLMQEKQYKKVIKILESELKKNPNDFKDRLRLAEAYEGAGRVEDAVKVYLEEGDSCISGGSTRQGIVLLKKALRLDPENGALSGRIDSLEKVGSGGQRSGVFSFDLDDAEAEDEVREGAAAGEEAEPSTADGPERAASEADSGEDRAAEDSGEFEVDAGEEGRDGDTARDSPAVEEPEPSGEAADGQWEAAETEAGNGATDVPPKEPADGAAGEPPAEERTAPVRESGSEVDVDPDDLPSVEGEAPEEETGAEPRESPTGPVTHDDPGDLLLELFPGLSPEDAAQVLPTLREIRLKPGDILLREGDPGDSLFLVTEGCLEASGRYEKVNLHLGELKRCDVIGEVAFLKGVPRTATIMAVEPSRLMELSKNAVRDRLERKPELMRRLESILEDRVARTIELLKQRWSEV